MSTTLENSEIKKSVSDPVEFVPTTAKKDHRRSVKFSDEESILDFRFKEPEKGTPAAIALAGNLNSILNIY